MNTNKEELFEQYLKNQLSQKDRADLELDLSNNAILRSKLEDFKSLKDIADLFQRQEIKNKVETVYKDTGSKKNTIGRKLVWLTGIAASVLIVMFWMRPTNIVDESKEYFTPYPDKVTVMGKNNSGMTKAMDYYSAKDYKKAVIEFNKLDSPEAQFYTAVSLLALEDPSNAFFKLKPFSEDKNSPFYEASLWYISLALLQQNKMPQAKLSLEKIVNNKDILYHNKDAQVLLDKIN